MIEIYGKICEKSYQKPNIGQAEDSTDTSPLMKYWKIDTDKLDVEKSAKVEL